MNSMGVSDNNDYEEEIYYDFDDNHFHHYHQQQLPHTLSRLSLCTSRSTDYSMGDINPDDGAAASADVGQEYLDMIRMYMSRVSIEGSVDDADDDDDEDRQSFDNDVTSEKENVEGVISSILSMSDSGKYDEPGCYSLPVTPKQRSTSLEGSKKLSDLKYDIIVTPIDVAKLYASENEADLRKDGGFKRASKKNRRNSRRRILREKWLQRAWEMKKKQDRVVYDDDMNYFNGDNNRHGHRSGSGGEFGNDDHYRHQLMVITRPCGGRRSLCMDFEEVKACRDLGFEFEHESTMFEFSSRHSGRGGSTMDTASAGSDGTSTVSNWRISSPGDDPKDVKARLKVWAQAVALASASHSRLLS